MTDLQMYILVSIPLIGILTNTALFIHLSNRLDGRIDSVGAQLSADIKAVGVALNALEVDVARLKDKVGMQ